MTVRPRRSVLCMPGSNARALEKARGIAADIETTAYEPPSHYAFSVIAGPARPHGEFRIAQTSSGVHVTFSLEAELSGLKKLLLGGPVQGSMNAEMAALDTAKRLLEGG